MALSKIIKIKIKNIIIIILKPISQSIQKLFFRLFEDFIKNVANKYTQFYIF